ncbi:MAG: anthranilate synthase component I family protein [Ginsengibacter sp.]
MKRRYTSFLFTDFKKFKLQLLNFGIKFGNFCFLDNHEYEFNKSYECIAGVGSFDSITFTSKNFLSQLELFRGRNCDWIFGHISYDLKNEIEDLSSANFDGIRFPELHFFVPEIVFIISKKDVSIGVMGNNNATEIFDEINAIENTVATSQKIKLQNRFSQTEYVETVGKIQDHIRRGDCYELCFCQEFFSDNAAINPVHVFEKLSTLSPNPFSAFYKLEENYLLCASPERFLKKMGKKIISQPIKGTSTRKKLSRLLEGKEKNSLLNNEKERAENIMIVDLVRNDLSKICTEGSVLVEEYLKVYSFPDLHQMISTISGNLNDTVSFAEIISATFPMGSMTGAPKKRAMQLIEKFERTKRGLFSGTVGYINPEGDFDFNVVIRSLLYNSEKKYLSIQAGSAITFKSKPEKEFEECNIKIASMMRALE